MGVGSMSAITEQLPDILAAQRADGEQHGRLLSESNSALRAGDLSLATVLADQAYEVLTRIRVRSRHMADLLTGPDATDSAGG
jgi:hypothetical protein